MKVVLFCGGYGMRMRDGASDLPKPMHPVGPRPLIWHVMRYYAHFGHKDFVLCLGYGAHHIKDFFLRYDETASNDFVLRDGGIELLGSDIQDWTITFVHTGLDSPIGERLRRVRSYVEGEEMFLANYADVLTDAPLDRMVKKFAASDAIGGLLAVPPQSAFHCVNLGEGDAIASRRVCATREGRPDDGLPSSWVLAAGRHREGADGPGGGLPERHPTVDAVGRPRPGPAAGRDRGAVGPARPLRSPVPRPSC
jgi:NDP-sugar pyrophosphorylase family protein